MKARNTDEKHQYNPNRGKSFFQKKEKAGFFRGTLGKEKSFFGPTSLQPKLEIGQPNDKYEQEADAMADKVMSGNSWGKDSVSTHNPEGRCNCPACTGSKLSQAGNSIQKQEEEEEDILTKPTTNGWASYEYEESGNYPVSRPVGFMFSDKNDSLQRIQMSQIQQQTTGVKSRNSAPSHLSSQLQNSKGRGKRLNPSTQMMMNKAFGVDFRQVKVHTDGEAIQMNQDLSAKAFTHGSDIYFNRNQYSPETREGRHLLAHELTHVVQQGAAGRNVVQRACETTAPPAGMNPACNTAAAGPPPTPTINVSFEVNSNTIIEADRQEVANFVRNWHSRGANETVNVDGFASCDGGAANNWRLSCDRATALAHELQNPIDPTLTGIPANRINISARGETEHFSSSSLPLNRRATASLPAVAPAPLTITSRTVKASPGGAANTRTRIGVGEVIVFTGNRAGNWSVNNGTTIGATNGLSLRWRAPAIGGISTIRLTSGGTTATISMNVVPPNGLSMTNVNAPHALTAGTAGACMLPNVTILPLDVNLGATQWLEVPGPGTNVTGYFTQFSAATLFHNPNPNYLGFDDNNTGLHDHAAWHAVPSPHSNGTFQWVIPNRYKLDGEPDASGRLFTTTTQLFTMDGSGTMTISKGGAFVSRTP